MGNRSRDGTSANRKCGWISEERHGMSRHWETMMGKERQGDKREEKKWEEGDQRDKRVNVPVTGQLLGRFYQ